jgi:ferrous iron transport protein B
LWASVIVWFLSYFPRNEEMLQPYTQQVNNIETKIENMAAANTNSAIHLQKLDSLRAMENELLVQMHEKQQYNSYLGYMGRFVEPAIRPIGFDWKIGVSLLSGIIAKEIVISTMGVLYAGGDEDSLREALQQQTHQQGKMKGEKIYSRETTLALLVFVLIYIPCIAVIAAIKKESGKWKWAIFNITYATTLAWLLAFAVSKITPLFL